MLQVLRLQQLSQINDRCLELQRNKAASHSNSSGGRKAAALNPTGNAGSTASGGGGGASDGSVHAAGDCGSQGVVGFMQQPRRQRSSGGSKLKKGKQAGCPFLAVEGGAAGWEDFTDLLLAAPIDVEELASLGREKKVGKGFVAEQYVVPCHMAIVVKNVLKQAVSSGLLTCKLGEEHSGNWDSIVCPGKVVVRHK